MLPANARDIPPDQAAVTPEGRDVRTGRFRLGNRASVRRKAPGGPAPDVATWRKVANVEEGRWRDKLRSRLVKRGGLAWSYADSLASEALHWRRVVEHVEALRQSDVGAWWAARAEGGQAVKRLAEIEELAWCGRKRHPRPKADEPAGDPLTLGDPLHAQAAREAAGPRDGTPPDGGHGATSSRSPRARRRGSAPGAE